MAIDMPPTRLILAYVLDWVLLICIVAVAGGISFVTPYHRPFSLIDLAISYPYVESDEISTALLVVLSLILPAIVIAIVTALFVPAFSVSNLRNQRYWKRKLWEFNAGWMGLGLSFALAFFVTTGIKNLIGKPRPDLLARCQPDLNDIAAHVVGGYGQDISQRWTLVSSSICTTMDKKRLDEGFRSFLSGHSSMSWSGLLYLSLWLASKFNMLIPYLGHGTPSKRNEEDEEDQQEARERAAAPPVFGAIIVLIPVCLAFYICSTRYVDFKHQGIDIFSGSVLGIVTAWIGFRWYHGSLTRGQPWTWSPRSKDRAFAVSSGTNGWTSGEGIVMRERMQRGREIDVEAGGSGDPIVKP
ncbi:PAP2-domain-containing protein [Aureobasidium namibiae CBS 147.97]|uniref:PAP2-domain-containing protein n=1 Tax=Aureobasidium namibiae CBS 147.97 TaxID=1043004 RepID=A0A074WKP9_9PEZI